MGQFQTPLNTLGKPLDTHRRPREARWDPLGEPLDILRGPGEARWDLHWVHVTHLWTPLGAFGHLQGAWVGALGPPTKEIA